MPRYNSAQKRAIAISYANKEKKQYKKRAAPSIAKRSKSSIAGSEVINYIAKNGLGALGSMLGPVGAGLGSLASKVMGFGDYAPQGFKVSKNSISMGNDPPEVANFKGRDVIVKHREYLGDIYTADNDATPGNFSIQGYPLNPGISTTFPWLSTIAQNFEQYELAGVLFEFKSTSADALNSTNTALGTVIMATQYDSVKLPFQNKLQMENHEFASSCKQSCSMLHAIECLPTQNTLNTLYTRIGAVPSGADPRMYDFGTFYIATVGSQAFGVNIGELWVTYDVILKKPELADASGTSSLLSFHYQNTGTTVNDVNPFGYLPSQGGTPTVNNYDTLSVLLTNTGGPNGDGAILFPPTVPNGVYAVTYQWDSGATGGTCQLPTWSSMDPTNANFTILGSNGIGTVLDSTAGINDGLDPTLGDLYSPNGAATGVKRMSQTMYLQLGDATGSDQRGIFISATGDYLTGTDNATCHVIVQNVPLTYYGDNQVPYVAPPYLTSVSLPGKVKEEKLIAQAIEKSKTAFLSGKYTQEDMLRVLLSREIGLNPLKVEDVTDEPEEKEEKQPETCKECPEHPPIEDLNEANKRQDALIKRTLAANKQKNK